jgi:translation initiation factor IF-2
MLTVGDLARDLKVKNEILLKELATMGFQVEGPESPLDTEDPAELREKLVSVLPKQEVIEKRIKPTVIRRRVKKKPASVVAKSEEPTVPEVEPESAGDPAVEESAEPISAKKQEAKPEPKTGKKPTKAKKAQRAKIIEKAPQPLPEEAAPPAEPVKAKKSVPKASQADSIEVAEPAPAPGAEAEAPPAEPTPEPVAEPVEEETQPSAESASDQVEGAQPEEGLEAASETPKEEEDKPAKKKKKKEKRMQPAQIIGRVELKKEEPPEPPRPRPVGPSPSRPPRPSHFRPSAPPPVMEAPVPDDEKRKRKKKDKKSREKAPETPEGGGPKVRRRKEVLLHKDLYDESRRGGRLRTKKRKPKQRRTEVTTPKAAKRRIKIAEVVSVSNLAHMMSVKSPEVIQQLLTMGVTATVNEGIDYDTAAIVASEFGFETETKSATEAQLLPTRPVDTEENLVFRPPVITVMGHVDHGKTSLLDAIRETHVTDREAGGITQHIGAYKVSLDRGDLVFLDTPGHEAFTAMRLRGAQVTDFVVLVVAADDGVMDQTREAINHARAAEVPIVVAVNKIDKPEADRDRVIRELSEHNLIPESWGGDTLFTYVSAKTLEGIDEFLELILLQAELMELKANPNKSAVGSIVEARLDKGRGAVATVLVNDGTLKLGDPFVAGLQHGKVRAMLDHAGKSLDEAGPAMPVEIQGFSAVPEAGDQFIVVDEEKIARQIGLHRQHKLREQEAAEGSAPLSLDDLMARMKAGDTKELNIIVKGDVQGSVEALDEALLGITSEEIKVKIIHSGVGTVTESDIMLAGASHAIILGFNVRPNPKTAQLAEDKGIDLRTYSVIYEAIEDVRLAMEGMLTPIEKESVVGRAEVRKIFTLSRLGTIAGCYVISGKIERSNMVRLLRDDVLVYEGKIDSMKRFKDDIRDASEGFECGIVLEKYNDLKQGDIIEAYVVEQEAAKLA